MEVEAKFGVPDRQTFDRLLEIDSLAGLDLRDRQVTHHCDQYLDTRDAALRAQGYACRLRQAGDRTLATLKGLGQAAGAVHHREELEIELPAPLLPPDWPPGEARDLALRLAGGQPLLPLLVIDQTRHTRRLHAAGKAVAVLSLDEVRVGRDGGAPGYLELEAELLPGGPEDALHRVAAVLEQEWRLRPETRSKFERALAAQAAARPLTPEERAVVEQLARQAEVVARRARLLLAWDDGLPRPEIAALARLSLRRTRYWLNAFAKQRLGIFGARLPASPPPAPAVEALPVEVQPPEAEVQPSLPKRPGMTPDDTMGQAGRKVLRLHFGRMVYHEPGTRLGDDIEALHDMRVSTRRLRAALRVFEPYFEPEVLARLFKGSRNTGRALGPVRDLDVFRAKTLAYMESLPEAERGGLDEFLAELVARREVARGQMLVYLDSRNYARFKRRMSAFVEIDGPAVPAGSAGPTAGSAAREPQPDRVRQVAPVAIYQRLAVVRAFDPEVNVPQPTTERLHALRIACKRLRYTLEFFEETLGPGTRALIKEIVSLQDHLGNLQDAVVASDLLAAYLASGQPGAAPGVEAYLAAQQSEMDRLLVTFPPAWQRFTSPAFSRMVAEAVAAL